MLIKEDLLKKLIESKVKRRYQSIDEGREERKYRRRMRRAKRAEIKAADTPEEKKEIRQKYKKIRKDFRASDKFEAGDEGETLDELINLETDDQGYNNVVRHLKPLMPEIDKIEQNYRGLKLVKALKSKKEKKFTIGQVKRLIKMGLIATRDRDYDTAQDKFCGAGVFLQSPKTPDRQPVNISNTLVDGIYKLCTDFEKIAGGLGGEKKIKSTKSTGKSSNKQCVMDIQETLNALNAVTPEVEQLVVDGKWGPKTSKAWNIACKANLRLDMEINNATVTEDIKGNVLKDWSSAAPQLNYEGDPCGARDFLNDLLKLRQDPATPPPPPVDPDWEKRRSNETQKAELDLEKLLTTDGGLSINYLYTVEEFQTEYDSSDIQSLIQVGSTSSTNVLQGNTYDVERYPSGPDGNSTFSTALYYDESKNLLVVDKVGDVAIRDIMLVGDKVIQKSFVSTNETIITNGDDVLLNETALRKLIRQQLISEALDASETETLIMSVVGELNDMAKDTDNFDAELINTKMKAGQAAMAAKKFAEAKKQFKAAASIVNTSSANLDPTKKANIQAVFTALANMVGSSDENTGKKAKSAVAKLKGGETKKASKKSGNNKVMKIQKQLNVLNKKDPELKIDGKWGKNTTAAWQKALNGNIGKLEELSKEAVTLADTKKKWPELAKILSATDKQFAGNINGVLALLDVLRDQQPGAGGGEAKKASKKEGPSIYEVGGRKFDRDYKGRSLGSGAMMVNLLKFPKEKLWGGGKKSTSPASLETYSSLKDFITKKPSGNKIIKVGRTEPGRTDKDKIETITVETLPSAAGIGQQTVLVLKGDRLIIDGPKFSNYSIYGYKEEGDFIVYTGE